MAAYNSIRSITKALTGTGADTVTLNQRYPAVEVTNFDTVNPVYVTMDGTTSPPVAVAEASNTIVVPPGTTKVLRAIPEQVSGTIVLSVVGNGGKYTIEGVS